MAQNNDLSAGMTRLGTVVGIEGRGEHLVQVTDRLWVSKDISDSILVATSAGNVVVNAGMPGKGAEHRRRFRVVSDQPIEYLILTQCHGDHFGGVPGLRDPDRFEAWLDRLTTNACLDLARRRRSRVIEVELTPLHESSVADDAARIADANYVERMLAGIEPGLRAVVVLHYFLDLTLPETAAVLGVPVGTAKSRLNRALTAMRIAVVDDDLVIAPAVTERFA